MDEKNFDINDLIEKKTKFADSIYNKTTLT